ncbi:hypothetical protein F5883DRAFT_240493 [Diaporthe sp. PMI_573]|nr:hypothetical protein F5883DRAFT_240493 [Diaporthaceae sp. PMI_573]
MRALENEEEYEEPPGIPVQPLPAPFPPNHTTPSAQLLKWPAVRKLVKPLLDREHIKYIESYPQRYEEDRGELPLFGRGEGMNLRAADRDFTYEHMDIPDDASVGDHPSPPAKAPINFTFSTCVLHMLINILSTYTSHRKWEC